MLLIVRRAAQQYSTPRLMTALHSTPRLTSAPSRALSTGITGNPWSTLGLPQGSSKTQIKRRFYELAKQTHPDTAQEIEASRFLDIRAAYEALLKGEVYVPPAAPSTSPNKSAAAACSSAKSTRRGAKGRMVTRQRTQGDFLCDRLREDPGGAFEVWQLICERELEVTSSMLEELFRACGARGGAGLDGALYILRDATLRGTVTPEQRELSMITMVKWCKEDGNSFAKIQAEMRETERTEAARENLVYANRLYTELAEGCSW